MDYGYGLNVCLPISFDDVDIFEYLDSLTLPTEPTDKEGLDDEAVETTMDFIKANLAYEVICEELTENTIAFKNLALHMENYIYLKRHAPHIYESLKKICK